MLDKMPLTTIDHIRFFAPAIGMFIAGTMIDLVILYLWSKWIDKLYTKRNSKNLYKIVQ